MIKYELFNRCLWPKKTLVVRSGIYMYYSFITARVYTCIIVLYLFYIMSHMNILLSLGGGGINCNTHYDDCGVLRAIDHGSNIAHRNWPVLVNGRLEVSRFRKLYLITTGRTSYSSY